MAGCPCGTGRDYAACCGRYIDGEASAPTAEALMRSRYTAYTRANIDYVAETHDPATRASHDAEGARAWAEGSQWLGLEILATEAGGEDDDSGKVEFVARFRNDDGEQEHREVSTFSKLDGAWYFTSGEVRGPQQVRRASPKVGRNDPCPCGSGKKYKKCCA
jgi:SEC-C motif-containing protein